MLHDYVLSLLTANASVFLA